MSQDVAQALVCCECPDQNESEARGIHSLTPLQSASFHGPRASRLLDKMQVHWRVLLTDSDFQSWMDFSGISTLEASYGLGVWLDQHTF